jgi:hypothetical protein
VRKYRKFWARRFGGLTHDRRGDTYSSKVLYTKQFINRSWKNSHRSPTEGVPRSENKCVSCLIGYASRITTSRDVTHTSESYALMSKAQVCAGTTLVLDDVLHATDMCNCSWEKFLT